MEPGKVVVTGGGTGGHVLPHFSVIPDTFPTDNPASGLRPLTVFYIGSRTGIERQLVEQNKPQWSYIPIYTGKLRRYASWRTLLEPIFIGMGFFQTLWFFLRCRPHVVFSKGGFVSAPVVWAAWVCRVPVVIHESDATPALTTRLTAPFATKICLSFEESLPHFTENLRKKCTVTGLPLRPELFEGDRQEALRFFAFENPDKPFLLVFGGSLGAQKINESIVRNREHLMDTFNIIHITGQEKGDGFSAPSYRQYPYLNKEMPLAYTLADVALCRAGASSLFELAAKGIPMVLVPLGLHQSRGDQIINAQIFKKKGWAQVLEEDALSGLSATLASLLDNLPEMKGALKNAPGPQAARLAVQKAIFHHGGFC